MTGDNTLIHSHGINRRDFMKLCAALAATMGLSSKAAAEMAESVTNPQRPPVIWIGAQECTGCTESLLRATHPTVENLVLETISLEYHEVLSAAGACGDAGKTAQDDRAIYQPFQLMGRKIILSDETLGAISQFEIFASRCDCTIGRSALL